jgi:hypothetical protein
MTETKDTRYPYTYACDLIRGIAGYGPTGTKLSRGDASQIRSKMAEILEMPDEVLAAKLADYYLKNQEELTDTGVKEFMAAFTDQTKRSKD